ncbi:hypothetical protein J2T57_001900 [Natronocella acetinitrilica]|uniref:Uncharacterized protein n=1 Tax=Natronocella acetinitrilica TaxID=414046 RepID=A0AAE3G3J9_9GAMM|nr:hypothetical protein [Natronocella acetinitrilica]MCP1674762.1 hypothetical protein [Natronocella acetinitrilica]
MFDIIFVLVTGFIAYHGITYRTPDGDKDTVRLYMGCIALVFCLWVLFNDVLGLPLRGG